MHACPCMLGERDTWNFPPSRFKDPDIIYEQLIQVPYLGRCIMCLDAPNGSPKGRRAGVPGVLVG